MSGVNEVLSTMTHIIQHTTAALDETGINEHGSCQMPKLLDHSIFSIVSQRQSDKTKPVVTIDERDEISYQNRLENVHSSVLKGNIEEFTPGDDIKRHIEALENECVIQCSRFDINYSDLSNLEKVMLLRLKLPQDIIYELKKCCELEATTIDTITYTRFRKMVLKKYELSTPLVHIVIKYLGSDRLLQGKETPLAAYNDTFLNELHPCMQPQSNEDCRKFVDLIQRTAYYASLTDPEVQMALLEIPEEHASLKKYMDVALYKTNLITVGVKETSVCYTSNRPYQCSECHKVFSESTDLSLHMKSHTSESQVISERQCQYSPYEITFSDSASKNPSIFHTEEIHLQNSQCSEDFSQNNNFEIHNVEHSRERSYKCSMCDKSCFRNSDLIRHMMTHTGERPYQCSLCGKGFTRKGSLKIHMGIHTEERPYKCSQCDKSFLDSTLLGNHMRDHTGERPYKCIQCDKAFKIKSNLKEHMTVHTGEKPHLCSQCGKAFARKTNLKKHMVIHTGERPYQCDQCGMAFSDDRNLIRHRMIHTGDRAYQCSQCPQAFFNNADLIRHLRIHTGERPYKCTQCTKAFRLNNSLILHMRTHTGERPYKCSQCVKAFSCSTSLKEHTRIHTGEKPYLCSLCGKAFSRKHHLINHRKTHSKII